MRRWLTLLAIPLATACAPSETERTTRLEAGYSDGYAVGFNTTCGIRTTLIEGDWDDPDYAEGYAAGQSAGTIACLNTRTAE